MSPTCLFIIGGFIVIGVFILTVFPQESLGATLNFTKPIFADTELGKKCSELWDSVQAIKRGLRDKLTGKETLETKLLTTDAEYISDCRPAYGGNPRIGFELPTGGINITKVLDLLNLTSK